MTKQLEESRLESITRNVFDSTNEMRSDKKTQLVGVKLVEDKTVVCEKITDYGDIYEMLQASSHHPEKFEGYDLIAVLTAGWAAPNDDDEYKDTAPSLHPKRKRVKLAMIGYTAKQTAAIMALDGDPEYIYTSGQGQGALQEAFEEMLNEIGW